MSKPIHPTKEVLQFVHLQAIYGEITAYGGAGGFGELSMALLQSQTIQFWAIQRHGTPSREGYSTFLRIVVHTVNCSHILRFSICSVSLLEWKGG